MTRSESLGVMQNQPNQLRPRDDAKSPAPRLAHRSVTLAEPLILSTKAHSQTEATPSGASRESPRLNKPSYYIGPDYNTP